MENNNIVNDIERIVKENMVQVIESNGRTFATKSLVEIEPRKDVAAEIRFSDLSSIVEIVKREMQRFVLPIYINIESEACVSVITSLDDEKDREKPYSAVAEALVRANCADIASRRVIATMAMLNAVIDESCRTKRQYRRTAQ